MNLQYLMKSIRLALEKHKKDDDLNVADCIEAIAVCIRIIARTDALIGAIVWSAVKLARGESSLNVAAMLEQIVRDIRLKAIKKTEKSIVGIS